MKFDYNSRYYLKSPFPKHPLISSRLYRLGQVFGFVFEELVESSFSNIALTGSQQKYDCWRMDTRSNLEIRTYGLGTKKLDLSQSKMQGINRRVNLAEHIEKNRKQDGYLVGIRRDLDDEYMHVLIGFIPSETVIQNKLLEIGIDELNELLDVDDTTIDEMAIKFRNERQKLYRLR